MTSWWLVTTPKGSRVAVPFTNTAMVDVCPTAYTSDPQAVIDWIADGTMPPKPPALKQMCGP